MNRSIALLLISDGRGSYLDESLASAADFLPDLDVCIHVDDSDHQLGFAGAIQAGWEAVLESGCDWVFHLEADFLFKAPVPIGPMMGTLLRNPDIAQMALKRQPWNDREKLAGGLIEADPEDHEEHLRSLVDWPAGVELWTTNRRCFTTNPSLYRAELCARGWPQAQRSEGIFTHELLAAGMRFGIWGQKYGPPWVEHIGTERAGNGY